MNKRTVVITGGGGFVGKYLIEELKSNERQTKIVVWDRAVDDLPDDVEGVEVDITNVESYRENLRSLQPEWVVHLAAVSSLGASLKDPKSAFRINLEGTKQLIEETKKEIPDTKVLVASTAEIYGQGLDTPL
jgi:GDP-4-dehydro-6-deoxy-D-mannose reductase